MKRIIFWGFIVFTTLTLKVFSEQAKPLVAFRADSLWYVIDSEGRGIFNPLQLNLITSYTEGFYRVSIEADGSKFWAFMTDKGEVAVPMCDDVRNFKEDMAMIIDIIDDSTEMRLYGFIDKKGKMLVPKEYLDATDFSEGLAWVMNREKRGYIDKTGRMVIPWDTTGFGSQFSEGLASMSNYQDQFGFINKKGEIVIDYKFDEVTRFVEGYARVNILGKWGFIDINGKLKVQPKYDFAFDFVDGFCFVGVPDSEKLTPIWGIINRGGGEVIDFQYDDVRDFSEGLGAVLKDGKWKYIDYMGNQIIPKLFVKAESFKNGLAFADDGDKTGFINPLGEFVFEIPRNADSVIDLRLNKKVK